MSPTARIGLFMIVALAILGVFIVKIEEIPIGAKSGRHRVQASFPSVAGLDEKSPVRIAGVRIGIVERIALQGDRALVTLALDPVTSAVIDRVIVEMKENLTVTMVTITHDMKSAFRIADRIAMLRDGRIIAVGDPVTFRATPDPYVQNFLAGEPHEEES